MEGFGPEPRHFFFDGSSTGYSDGASSLPEGSGGDGGSAGLGVTGGDDCGGGRRSVELCGGRDLSWLAPECFLSDGNRCRLQDAGDASAAGGVSG